MGTCCHTYQRIEDTLQQEQRENDSTVKILLLGNSGSGKSTMMKQLRLLHTDDEYIGEYIDERLHFKQCIFSHIVDQMKVCYNCVETKLSDEMLMAANILKMAKINHNLLTYGYIYNVNMNQMVIPTDIIEMIYKYANNVNNEAFWWHRTQQDVKPFIFTLTKQITNAIDILWNAEEIKHVYFHKKSANIQDSCCYYFNEIHRISNFAYTPNDKDIVMFEQHTTQMNELKFEIHRNKFHIIDVSGQKSERRKWIHCFEFVTAVIYMSSLSCYNEKMDEDGKNCMVDSIELFDAVCNNEWFKDVFIILFLNKKDLFIEKIQKIPITQCPAFSEYTGHTNSYDETTEFIKDVFEAQNRNGGYKMIYTHLTCVADKNQTEKVFNDIQTIGYYENSCLAQDGLIA